MLSTIFKIFSFFEKSQKKYIYFIFFIVLLSMIMETLTIGAFAIGALPSAWIVRILASPYYTEKKREKSWRNY